MVIAIVVTYNGSKWIDRCFGSLLNSIISIKILAIDNGSIDGTPDLIRKKFPEVEVIETGENLGFGKANNIGLQVALRDNFDYAFLLNQDAWIETETIEKLIMTHKKQPEYGIVSPIHLNAKGDALDYWFSIYISPENCNGLFSDVFVKKNIDKIYDVGFVNAAGWLITRKCIHEVGGFNPSFFHYGEDNDYIHRVNYHGLKVGIYPKCSLFHDREKRALNLKYDNEKEIYKKSLITHISNPNLKTSFITEIKKILREFIRYLIFMQFYKAKRSILQLFVILSLDKITISKNRKESELKGPSFL